MDKLLLLKRIKDLYEKQDINIMRYLRDTFNEEKNDLADILISYDFQAGTYVEQYLSNPDFYDDIYGRLIMEISRISHHCKSILECGCGEATTLVPVVNAINNEFEFVGGIDISWSRIRYGIEFAKNHLKKGRVELAVGDMFSLPCDDNSFDIVFTKQAIEPNRGKEKEILSELYRVCNKYLVLVEPAYELASEEARRRMDEHGYITSLYATACDLGYDILTWEMYDKTDEVLNPTGIMIIKKKEVRKDGGNGGWSCPNTRTQLKLIDSDIYYSDKSLLAYPIVDQVPCLTKDNAIIATKMMEIKNNFRSSVV